MQFVGIDYSLTSPSVTILQTETQFKTFFIASCKREEGFFFNGTFVGVSYPIYSSEMNRYVKLSEFITSNSNLSTDSKIFIENYSMGSKGKVFHIAENTAILKKALYDGNHSYETVPPTVLKKFATGKGNSDKTKMYEHFVIRTGINLKLVLSHTRKDIDSPISDIVDSYFLALYGFKLHNQ